MVTLMMSLFVNSPFNATLWIVFSAESLVLIFLAVFIVYEVDSELTTKHGLSILVTLIPHSSVHTLEV